MRATSAELGKLSGMKAIQFTAELLRRGAAAILQDAPEVIAREKMDALLVDQVASAGGTVGDQLGLPHVTVCNALAMNPDPHVPPGVLPWRFAPGLLGRARNAFGYALLRWLARPVVNEIDRHRVRHRLPRLAGGLTASSGLAQIAQQPAFFDFPRKALPDCFHFTGPWHDEGAGAVSAGHQVSAGLSAMIPEFSARAAESCRPRPARRCPPGSTNRAQARSRG